jgi:hypothetical protein
VTWWVTVNSGPRRTHSKISCGRPRASGLTSVAGRSTRKSAVTCQLKRHSRSTARTTGLRNQRSSRAALPVVDGPAGEYTRLAIDISDREWVTGLLRCAACRRLAKSGLVQRVEVSEETESPPSHWGWKRSTLTSLESASEFISTSAGVVGRGSVPC